MPDFLRQFRNLKFSDKLRLCGIVPLVLAVKIGLYIWGFKRIVSILTFRNRDFSGENEKTEIINQYHNLLILTYQIFRFEGMCLAISIVFWRIFLSQKIETDLRIGMKKENGLLLAHAWIEYQGVPLTIDYNIQNKYIPFENIDLININKLS